MQSHAEVLRIRTATMKLGRRDSPAYNRLSQVESSLCLLHLDFAGACLRFAPRMPTAVFSAILDVLVLPAVPFCHQRLTAQPPVVCYAPWAGVPPITWSSDGLLPSAGLLSEHLPLLAAVNPSISGCVNGYNPKSKTTIKKTKSSSFHGGSVVKNPPASARDTGSILDSRRSHGP